MRITNTLAGSSSLQTVEQFHPGAPRKNHTLAICLWLDRFGLLDPEVVVNPSPKLDVSVDFVIHGHWLGERFMGGAETAYLIYRADESAVF